jgi:DNA-binding NarL/FixJ family response regulator
MEKLGERTAVLVDQHPLWLEALERLLGRLSVRVVGKTTKTEEAIALVEEQRPDMLISEHDPYDVNGNGNTLQQARERHPDIKWMVLSAHDDRQHIEGAFAAGASVYCVKTAEPEDLAAAIRQAFEHSVYFAGAQVRSATRQPTADAVEPSAELTPRELEILQLVAEGHSNAQLARMLWVTEQTVKFHLSNIYRKLDVANRTEASRWAQLHGLLAGRPPQSTG